jgi:hypothetical protein
LAGNLLVRKGRNAGQHFAFEEFQAGAAAGAHESYFVRQPALVERFDAVATTNDALGVVPSAEIYKLLSAVQKLSALHVFFAKLDAIGATFDRLMNNFEPGMLALPLLHDSATAGDGSDSDWRAWLDYFGRPDIACHGGQHFSEAGMLISAAMLGLGVALARASLAADQIASGALVCPLNLAAPTAYSYYLLGLPEVVDRPKIASFRRLLVAEAAATEASVLAIGSPAANAAAEVAALPVGA